MKKDVEENPDLYKALAADGSSEEDLEQSLYCF